MAWPTLSPDRQKLAYAAQDGNGVWHIYVAALDGTDTPRLIADGWAPAWGPTGLIAYTGCTAEGACGIFVVNPAGGEAPQRLTNSENDTAAAWSPAGDRLAYMTLDNGNWGCVVGGFGGQHYAPGGGCDQRGAAHLVPGWDAARVCRTARGELGSLSYRG